MIGASTTLMIGGSHLAFWRGTLVLSSIIPLVSFLFVLPTGELFACSLFDCLVGALFSLTLVLLFSLGVAYQSSVYSPSVVGIVHPLRLRLDCIYLMWAYLMR